MSQREISKPGSIAGLLVRRIRQWLAAIAAVAIIATAVVVGVGRLLIPYADELRPWLAAQLSERLGHPVSIERVDARWPRLTPQITLNGLRAGSEESPIIEVTEARLELHLPDLFRADHNPLRLVVLGFDLLLAEDESGRWGVSLEEGGRLSGDGLAGQGLGGDLVVRDVSVRIRPRTGPHFELVIQEGEIRRRGEQTGLVARAHLAAAPEAELSLSVLGEHRAGRLLTLNGRVDLRHLRLEAPGLERLLPDFLRVPPDRLDANLAFDWQSDGGGSADLDVELSGSDGFDADARLRVERRDRRIDAELVRLRSDGRTLAREIVVAHEGERWAVSVPALALADVHQLLSRWLGGWSDWPVSMGGRVRELELLYEHPGSLHRLDGSVDGLEVDLAGERPRLTGLDLGLGIAGDRAALSLSGSPVIDWPAKMRQPIPIERISGRLIVSPRAIEIDGITGWRPEAEARADGWVWLGGGRPFLDFIVISERVEAVDPRPWLPAGKIPPKALAWLDRALLGIAGATGGLNYHFRLGHELRDWHDGAFQAWVDFRGADLDYWAGWPLARDLEGRVDFVGRSMVARIERGRLGPVPLSADRITIDNLVEPEISISLSARQVAAEDVRATVAAFPFEGWSRFLDPVAASGELSLETDLFLPIPRMADWRLDGRVAFEGTTLAVPSAGLRLPELRGSLAFDRQGLEPARLELAQTELEIAAGFTPPAWASVSGQLAPARLFPERPSFSFLKERINGSSRWEARVGARTGGGWQLELRSDLSGLALDLPAPLDKPGDRTMPLQLSLAGHDQGRLAISARLGELLELDAEETNGRWRVSAGLRQSAPPLPSAAGFEVAGSVERLDLKDWSDWLAGLPVSPPGQGDADRARIKLQIGRLDYGDLSLQEVALDARRSRAQWQMALSGESVEGEVTVPLPVDSGRVVAVELERLDLARSLAEAPADDLAQAPVPGQTRTHVPTEFPPIHLLIESLHYGELPLGRVRIESHARQDGIEIERVDVSGPHLELTGYGRWILAENGPVTEFDGRLISTGMKDLLAALGHESQFGAARAQVDLDGRWPGAPFDFSLARLSGTMHLLMTDGNIPEAQPGAGRLVGLISLSAMPRRLMLDFRDVFGQGLKFDRIEGRFDLAAGVARTDGLKLESPAADITVTGSTDLGGRSYDQTVRVEPGVGGTLPVLGGLAGGPAGAAAGLILRSLLERPLQGIAEARYRVTGPWEDPDVELIGARAAEPELIEPDPQEPVAPSGDSDDGTESARPD